MKRSTCLADHSKRQFTMNGIVGFRLVRRILLGNVLAVFLGGAGQASTASENWIAATTAMQTPQLSAFASAQSSGLITIAASEPGIIAGFSVLPGETVAAGQVIARLGGPQITTAVIQAKAALAGATAAQRAAETSLTVERGKLQQHLSTYQLVAQAQSALAAAIAQTTTAQANVRMLEQAITLSSPLAGVVQSVAAANGDILATGQEVATIQPSTGNWLKAVFYGTTVTPGASGVFTPGNGGKPIAVNVRGALGVSRPDGGMPVALTAAQAIAPGAFGTVTLDLPAQRVTLVPSEALILDKGQWWVMLHTPQGDHPVQVTPGPAEGYDTVIKSGVNPGDDVVVVNAYLLYHRGIAAVYQPSD
jgi:multidrug efflux pump subunit AcrA (membrane-fusion protein)